MTTPAPNVRAIVLDVIDHHVKQNYSLQSIGVVQETSRRIGRRGLEGERAILAAFYGLFRTGYLSWGHDLANPAPPFFHVTPLGEQALVLRTRDPGNPDGYLAHLTKVTTVTPVTTSYVAEALNTFNAACFKATAVMIGAAAERLVLEIRDTLVARLQALGHSIPSDLADWRVKRILGGIETAIVAKKAVVPTPLFERFEANWPAFIHQIRTARSDAGHPASVDPVTAEEVHASLLLFPELATLAKQIEAWIKTSDS